GPHGTESDWRDTLARHCRRLAIADLTRTASGPHRGPGEHQPRGSRGVVPEPEDGRIPPRQHLPQTRRAITRRTRPPGRGPRLTDAAVTEVDSHLLGAARWR